MTSPAKLLSALVLLVLLAAGCTSNQATPKATATAADTTACHAFGAQIVHGSATHKERERLIDELPQADNPALRKEANAMKTAIATGDTNGELKAADNFAGTCYALGLLSSTGQPT